MSRLLTYWTILFPLVLLAQEETLNIGGMTFSYELNEDSIEIKLTAPTNGWIGVGFNNRDNIVKSDLLLFNVVSAQPNALDMYVVGFGNPREDSKLGGSHSIKILDSQETIDKTYVHFIIPMKSNDRYDFQHEIDQDFWLILAYSTHDDFAHHSRMRKHVKYRFENK